MVAGEDHAVEVLGELVRIGVGSKLTLRDAGPEDRSDHVEQVALVPDQTVPNDARLVVELRRSRDERATAGQRIPPQPEVEQLPHPRLASRSAHGRADDGGLEPRAGVLEHRQLQRLLRPEMGEEAALGQLGLFGE